MPSIPHTNVVSAIMMGTTGSGNNNPSLNTLVKGLSYIDPTGEKQELTSSKEAQNFMHTFGALGIVYSLKLRITPAYTVLRCIYKDVPFSFLQAGGDLFEDHDYLAFFTDWREAKMTSLWVGEI